MTIAVSVVSAVNGKTEEVRAFLEELDAVEIYGASPDGQILILTDMPDAELEKLCEAIREHESVIDVLQHSFYFEE